MTDLERAAEEWSDTHRSVRFGQIESFIAGAKWALERAQVIARAQAGRAPTMPLGMHHAYTMGCDDAAKALAGEGEK